MHNRQVSAPNDQSRIGRRHFDFLFPKWVGYYAEHTAFLHDLAIAFEGPQHAARWGAQPVA